MFWWKEVGNKTICTKEEKNGNDLDKSEPSGEQWKIYINIVKIVYVDTTIQCDHCQWAANQAKVQPDN